MEPSSRPRVGDLRFAVCGTCQRCQGKQASLSKDGHVYLWNTSCLEQDLEEEHWVVETLECCSVVLVLENESPMDLKVVHKEGVVGWLPREECGENV